MTHEEAKKIILNLQVGALSAESKDLYAACALAVKALERNLPKRPVNIVCSPRGDVYQGYCPNCSHYAESYEMYCCRCGQKFEWQKGAEG